MKAVELCQLRGAGGGGDTWHGATKFGGNIGNSCVVSKVFLCQAGGMCQER